MFEGRNLIINDILRCSLLSVLLILHFTNNFSFTIFTGIKTFMQACKDYQRDPDFCVVARMEAFIAGWGLEEALVRADIALGAGADAILVHSKRRDAQDIEAFMRYWGTRVCKTK